MLAHSYVHTHVCTLFFLAFLSQHSQSKLMRLRATLNRRLEIKIGQNSKSLKDTETLLHLILMTLL